MFTRSATVPLIFVLICFLSTSVSAAPKVMSDLTQIHPPTEKSCLQHRFAETKQYNVQAYLFYGYDAPAVNDANYWEDVKPEDLWIEDENGSREVTIPPGSTTGIYGPRLVYFCVKLKDRQKYP